MSYFVGIDLHCNNAVVVIIDENGKCVSKNKIRNDLAQILSVFDEYSDSIAGIVVESTYNWYWLIDGLEDQGFRVHLAHTLDSAANRSKKYTDDYRDAFGLADSLRLGRLKEGYIYPRAERPLRDLLRKRSKLVQNRTQYLVSLSNSANRHLGVQIGGNELKKLDAPGVKAMFPDEHSQLAMRSNQIIIKELERHIKKIETTILKAIKLRAEFKNLLSIPGIGTIIAQTICLEVGDIHRFKNPGCYVSYTRCAPSDWISNSKKKGEGNRKNGNKFLSWAYIEAANFTLRFCPHAKAYYKKKFKKTGKRVIALKSLAAKLARATYYMLRDGSKYDPEKLFGPLKTKSKGEG